MSRHISALQHLREAAKSTNNALDNLERCLGILTEGVGQTVGVIRVSGHAHASTHAAHPVTTHTSIHPSHASHAHAAHSTHASIHPAHPTHPTKPRVWG